MNFNTLRSDIREFEDHHIATGPDDPSLRYLEAKEEGGKISFGVVEKIDQDISNYASETLKKMKEAVEKTNSKEELALIACLATDVVEEYESVNNNRTFFQIIINAVCVFFGFRESQDTIEIELNKILVAEHEKARNIPEVKTPEVMKREELKVPDVLKGPDESRRAEVLKTYEASARTAGMPVEENKVKGKEEIKAGKDAPAEEKKVAEKKAVPVAEKAGEAAIGEAKKSVVKNAAVLKEPEVVKKEPAPTKKVEKEAKLAVKEKVDQKQKEIDEKKELEKGYKSLEGQIDKKLKEGVISPSMANEAFEEQEKEISQLEAEIAQLEREKRSIEEEIAEPLKAKVQGGAKNAQAVPEKEGEMKEALKDLKQEAPKSVAEETLVATKEAEEEAKSDQIQKDIDEKKQLVEGFESLQMQIDRRLKEGLISSSVANEAFEEQEKEISQLEAEISQLEEEKRAIEAELEKKDQVKGSEKKAQEVTEEGAPKKIRDDIAGPLAEELKVVDEAVQKDEAHAEVEKKIEEEAAAKPLEEEAKIDAKAQIAKNHEEINKRLRWIEGFRQENRFIDQAFKEGRLTPASAIEQANENSAKMKQYEDEIIKLRAENKRLGYREPEYEI